MKKLPYIIGIPAIAVALVLGGAMLWKLKNQTVETMSVQPGPLPGSVNSAGGAKPANPFSALFGPQTAQPTAVPSPASIAAMNADLNTVGDDGGASDFTSLQKDASGL